MKHFLATTAIVLALGGTVYAAPASFDTYKSQATDMQASEIIGQTVYATEAEFAADQAVAAGAQQEWDNIGEINEVILGRDGAVKAVILGVGGFLGIGEKDVAVSMNDIRFVRNGEGADDYFLVVNSTKEALNNAPAYVSPDDMRTAANTTMEADPATTAMDPAATTTADTTTAADPATTTADTTTAADPATTTADSTTATPEITQTMDSATTDQAADATATPDTATGTDTQTTASTTTDDAVKSTMDESRQRLVRPDIARDGYRAAEATELTAERLQGARVYGAQDEDVGEVNRLVLNDNGQVELIVLDIGGFLGIGEREIAVSPDELNIVRADQGDDLRVYIDASKPALEAQPEYKSVQ